VPASDTKKLNIINSNVVTFTQCVISDNFTARLLFAGIVSYTVGRSVMLYRVTVNSWSANSWLLPNGWTITKTAITMTTIIQNRSQNQYIGLLMMISELY